MSDRIDNLRFGLLATSVAAVIATHLGHLPAWFAAVLFATIALRAVSRRRGAPTVPVWVRIPLAALLLAWITMSFGNVFGREPGSVLGCGLLALKLLETERVRDARVAVGFEAFVFQCGNKLFLFFYLCQSVFFLLHKYFVLFADNVLSIFSYKEVG